MVSICPVFKWSGCQVFKWSGCQVFKWHSKTRLFGIWPLFDHLNTRYSETHCNLIMSFFVSGQISAIHHPVATSKMSRRSNRIHQNKNPIKKVKNKLQHKTQQQTKVANLSLKRKRARHDFFFSRKKIFFLLRIFIQRNMVLRFNARKCFLYSPKLRVHLKCIFLWQKKVTGL